MRDQGSEDLFTTICEKFWREDQPSHRSLWCRQRSTTDGSTRNAVNPPVQLRSIRSRPLQSESRLQPMKRAGKGALKIDDPPRMQTPTRLHRRSSRPRKRRFLKRTDVSQSALVGESDDLDCRSRRIQTRGKLTKGIRRPARECSRHRDLVDALLATCADN